MSINDRKFVALLSALSAVAFVASGLLRLYPRIESPLDHTLALHFLATGALCALSALGFWNSIRSAAKN
jgi:hypothetical protein